MNFAHFLLAAVTVNCPTTDNCSVSGGSGFADPSKVSLGSAIHTGVNAFAFVIGAVSIIMVLVGAIRYTLSAGDPKATAGAKDTILYAVIGLVISILSLAIVNFVVGKFQ